MTKTLINVKQINPGSEGQILTVTGGVPAWGAAPSGSGTVTSVSVVTANGISGSVATETTTPAITLTLGVITPTSVNGLTLAAQATGFTISGGTTSKTLTVALDASVSGTNTGDGTYGIANTNYVKIDAADVADNDYAKFTANGLEGRSYAEVLSDIGAAPTTSPTFATSITGSYLTASEILITDADKKIVSAPVATYPSLTELSYVKGVTSAIQTQLGNKAPSANPTFTGTVILPKTVEIQDTSADHQYVLAVSELTADRTITLPLLTGNDTFVFNAHTATLSNKRITQRVATTTDDSTAVIDVDTTDVYELSAVANATTFSTTGTPTDGQKLIIRFKDAGTAKGLTWDAVFVAIGVTAPTTTVAGKWHYVGATYNSAASKWHIIATGVQA